MEVVSTKRTKREKQSQGREMKNVNTKGTKCGKQSPREMELVNTKRTKRRKRSPHEEDES